MSADITPQHHKIYTSALLPVLVSGVMASKPSADTSSIVCDYMKRCAIFMSKHRVPLSALCSTITSLV